MTARRFQLQIEGMHCGSCVRRVTAALNAIPGVSDTSVSIGRADGTLDLELADEAAILRAVVDAGFAATAIRDHA